MIERRDFMGAIAALFCGVALPGRELLRTVSPSEAVFATHMEKMLPAMAADMDAVLKELYVQPIMRNILTESELLAEFGVPSDKIVVDQVHYFEIRHAAA